MSMIQPFFAQDTLNVDVVSAPWTKMNATTRDILITLGAVTLVTGLALIWAVVFRRRRRRSHSHNHHHHHHRHHHSSEESASNAAAPEEEPAPAESSSRRRGRRHGRREHRPRNPTLA